MPKRRFSEEYEAMRRTLQDCAFAQGKEALIGKLKRLCEADGPDVGTAGVLGQLREHCERGVLDKLCSAAKHKESAGIRAIAGAAPHQDKKAAALKTLRHLHLKTRFGGHSLWVLSLPGAFTKWPSDQLAGKSGDALDAILDDASSRFSGTQMRDLAHSSQSAGAWANKAMAICSATKGVGAESREQLIRRWFMDEATDAARLPAIADTLREGFRKIAVAALSKQLILTDNPIDRGTEDENTNAYVWGDTLNVVYIEKGFFGDGGDPLSGQANWTRILVHELSHSQLKTEDIAYRWQGLRPRAATFTTAQALNNADSWAFFAADANGMLTPADRSFCLQ
jgi:hypothetical protein